MLLAVLSQAYGNAKMANSVLRNDGEIGGMRGIGGTGRIGGMGRMGGIGRMKFDPCLKLNCWFYVEFRPLIWDSISL